MNTLLLLLVVGALLVGAGFLVFQPVALQESPSTGLASGSAVPSQESAEDSSDSRDLDAYPEMVGGC